MINLADFGAALDGAASDSDAFDRALSAALASRKSCTLTWVGDLTLTRPTPNLDRVHLEGGDIYGARVKKKFPGGVLFRFEGRAGYSGGGLHNFSVVDEPETAGSYIILARAKADGYAPDGLQLEHLYLGSGRSDVSAFRAIEIDGTRRFPLGARQVRIHDVTCFGSSAPGTVYLAGTRDLYAQALRVYPAGGSYGDIVQGPDNQGLVLG